MKVLIYAYYSKPWELRTGDDIRIHYVTKVIGELFKSPIVVLNLSHLISNSTIMFKDRVMYVSIPRKFYLIISKLVRWNQQHDLNPLIKLTHYVDEFITAIKIKLASAYYKAEIVYIFGSMTLLSLFLRLLRIGSKIIYDPLANYAQTLYIRSRTNRIELLRYGLYLALHKLQLKYSDFIIYPSRIDLENAKKMFNLRNNVIIIPNPMPFCYKSVKEYTVLRIKREDFTRPYFILLAGGKGKANEEAVRLTIKVFNNLEPPKFKLIITGPWLHLKNLIKNPSIEVTGVIPRQELKKLLAQSDVGLSPIFTHAAGTFMKILAYIGAGLSIIASPVSIIGLDYSLLQTRKVIFVKDPKEYEESVKKLIELPISEYAPLHSDKKREIMICDYAKKSFNENLKELDKYIRFR